MRIHKADLTDSCCCVREVRISSQNVLTTVTKGQVARPPNSMSIHWTLGSLVSRTSKWLVKLSPCQNINMFVGIRDPIVIFLYDYFSFISRCD